MSSLKDIELNSFSLVQGFMKALAYRDIEGDIKQPQLLISLDMVKIGNGTKLFAGVGLAVPRLGNVRLRLHFLRRGTSGTFKAVFLVIRLA